MSLEAEFVVRVSPLLHQAILALFDDRNDRERTGLLVSLAMLELHQAEDSATFIPLPQEPRCRRAADIVLGDPTGSHEIETLAREVGTSARTLSRLFASETQLSFKSWCQRARIAAAIERLSMESQCLGQAARLGSRLRQRAGVFARVPAGHRQDSDGIFRGRSEAATAPPPRKIVIRGLDPRIHHGFVIAVNEGGYWIAPHSSPAMTS